MFIQEVDTYRRSSSKLVRRGTRTQAFNKSFIEYNEEYDTHRRSSNQLEKAVRGRHTHTHAFIKSVIESDEE